MGIGRKALRLMNARHFSKLLVLVSCYCLAESNWFLSLTWSLQIIMVLLCIQPLCDCRQWRFLKKFFKKRPQAVEEPRAGGCYDYFIRTKSTKSSVQEPGWPSLFLCPPTPAPRGTACTLQEWTFASIRHPWLHSSPTLTVGLCPTEQCLVIMK